MISFVYFIFALSGYILLALVLGIWFVKNRPSENMEQKTLAEKHLEQSDPQKHCFEEIVYTTSLQNGTLQKQKPVASETSRTYAAMQNGTLQQRILVGKLRDYILDDKTISMTVIDRDKFALALSTNRTTLSKSVRAVTEKTLMEYINIVRLEEAVKKLEQPSGLTLEAIAEAYGFTYCKFYRLFKEHYHITPSEYCKKAYYS